MHSGYGSSLPSGYGSSLPSSYGMGNGSAYEYGSTSGGPTPYNIASSHVPPAPPQIFGAFTQSSHPTHGKSHVSPWFFDSGATSHVTYDSSQLHSSHERPSTEHVTVGNGHNVPVANSGKGILSTPHTIFRLDNVLHVPLISHNLLSVHQFALDNNCIISFDSHGYVIQDKTSNQILHHGSCHQGLYPLLSSTRHATALLTTGSSAELWHQRLGHPHAGLLQILSKQYNLPISPTFSLSTSHTNAPFELVHMDVWGPSPVPSFSGYKYYLLLVDDFTKYCWLFPLKLKSEVTSYVQAFKAFVANHFSLSIKTIRSDNGGEFLSKLMHIFFAHFGIVHETSCPHTLEQNGVAERKHRHIIETAITLLQQANLPITFWLEAITTALYLMAKASKFPGSTFIVWHRTYSRRTSA